MSRVLILDTDYKKISRDIDKVFEEFDFDFNGKKVFLKPNILAAFVPEKAVTTHPSVVEATVGCLLKRGAIVLVGDNSGMRTAYGNNESVAKVTGIYDSSLGKYNNIACHAIRVKTGIKGNSEITVSRAVFDCDIFISMPKFKTHLNTIISGAIKNSYGLLVGAEKMRLHALFPEYDKFAKVIVEVFKVRPPDLIIMDAILGMEGDGPNSPSLRQINKIIASTDAVSLDSVMCYMMGANPEWVHTLNIAREAGLGEADLKGITILGKLEKINNFKLPVTYKKPNAKDSAIVVLLAKLVNTGKLRVMPRSCSICKQCYENCPAGAIQMNKYPRIDTKKCILCFCCKEICPNHAINVGGLFGLLQRVLK